MKQLVCKFVFIGLIGCGTQPNTKNQPDSLTVLCTDYLDKEYGPREIADQEITACVENPPVAVLKKIELSQQEKSFSNREIP